MGYDRDQLPTNVLQLLAFQANVDDAGQDWYKNISANALLDLYHARRYGPTTANDRGHHLGAAVGREQEFDMDDEDYTKGLLDMGIACMVFGCVVLICIPLVYCCMAKCKCCCRKEKTKPLLQSNVRWWYVFVSLVTVAFAITYAVGLVLFNQNINQWENSLDKVAEAFYAVNDLADSIVVLVANTFDSVGGISAAVDNCTDIGQYVSESLLANLTFNTTLVAGQANITVDTLTQIAGLQFEKLANDVTDVSDSIAKTDTARIIIGYVLLALLIVVMLAYVVAGWVNFFASSARSGKRTARSAAWFSCLASPVALMVVVGAFVITGASIVLSAASGDYCQDPDTNTLNTVGGKPGSTENKLITYYTTCNATNVPIEAFTITVREAFVGNLNEYSGYLDTAHEIADATAEACPLISSVYSQLELTLFEAWVGILKLSLVIECPVINQLYTIVVYNTFCKDMSHAATIMFAGSLGLVVTLGITMVLYRLMIVQKKVEENEENRAFIGSDGMDEAPVPKYKDQPGDSDEGGNGHDGDGIDLTDVRSPLRPGQASNRVLAAGQL